MGCFVIESLHKKIYLHYIIKLENVLIAINVNKNILRLLL